MTITIPEALKILKTGKMCIVVDDEDRENEGDLVCAAQFITPEIINFMATHGKGLICLALEPKRIEQLKLPLMSQFRAQYSQNAFKTAFTLSIEAKVGVSTGISAADRAHTILCAIDPAKGPDDLVSPGHIFPLRAQEGGVLVRPGHTEASVDLARLAGLQSAGVICEIMQPDGTMARLSDLEAFSKTHQIPIITIKDLITYRTQFETFVERISSASLPTKFSDTPLELIGFRNLLDGVDHVAIVSHPITDPTLVRVHSECLTGDSFGSLRCDCGPQLESGLRQIAQSGGVLIYLRQQEGRGIGLGNKIRAYSLQDQGLDTVEANLQLGFKADHREYGVAAQIFTALGIQNLRLLTNNPLKLESLEAYGLKIVEHLPLLIEANVYNQKYLTTKKEKLGHRLP